MRRDKIINWAVALVLLVVPSALWAQGSSTINTFSPYSMYGLGEIQTQGTLSTRSMGGAGIAMNDPSTINLLNPAAYSTVITNGILFDFGLEGNAMFIAQKAADQTKRSGYTTGNFHDIALLIPLYKGLGFGFSLTPYSNVGYDISTNATEPNIGIINYAYSGSGDITEVKFGLGWEFYKDFSVGVAAQYYWGDINRNFTMVPVPITGNGAYSSTIGISEYAVSKIKAQFGAQWRAINTTKQRLTLAATYDIGGNLQSDYTHNVYGSSDIITTPAKADTTHLPLILPSQIGTGVYYQTPRMSIAVDYVYQNWQSSNPGTEESTSGMTVGYCNANIFKAGIEYTPNRRDIRNFFNRVTYRAGARFGDYHQTFGGEKVPQYALTGGFGMPVRFGSISRLDFGVELGGVGSLKQVHVQNTSVGLIRQNYIKFAIGLSLFGEDYWFQRPKFD